MTHKLDATSLHNTSCLGILEKYNTYWKNDSLGKNGFRDIAIDIITSRCALIGTKWDSIEEHLGKPNATSVLGNQVYHRYVLVYYSEEYMQRSFGIRNLDIYVSTDGFITYFASRQIDM